jgi:hypothetical protein
MGGWSMGWDVKDADDGRTLRPLRENEFLHTYDEYGLLVPGGDVPPSGSRQVLLYHDQKFIPETVYIRPNQVLVTEWESIYSSAFTLNGAPFSVATFSPVIDDRLKVVGHVGWADGNDIIVPEHTIRNNRLFWSVLQKVRLDDEQQRLLDDDARRERARPFPDSPLSRPTTSAPKDPRRWSGPEICVPRPPTISLDRRVDEARRGPLKDKSTEETYRIDLDLFVTGGGRAFVGRHFVRRGDASYLPSAPGVPERTVGAPKKPFSSGYEFLVLVDPEGHLQHVMGVRKNLYSYADAMMFSLELALTLSMFLDIAPIAVVLLRAGVKIATEVMIEAIRLVIDREAKELVELTLDELAAVIGGGVAPKEAAESAARALAESLAKKEGKFSVEEMIAHLTNVVRQHPELRRLMAARVLTEQRLTSATLEILGDWARAGGRRVVWKTEAEMVKVTKDATNLMTRQGNEFWINEEAKALKEAGEFYRQVVHELASDSLGIRGTGQMKRFIEMKNGMPFSEQTLLENAIQDGDIEKVVRFFAGG